MKLFNIINAVNCKWFYNWLISLQYVFICLKGASIRLLMSWSQGSIYAMTCTFKETTRIICDATPCSTFSSQTLMVFVSADL